jgi:serine protease Do
MKISRLIPALLLGLLIAQRVAAAALSPAEIAEKATPSVVLIKVPDGLGTGFVVAEDGRIVTNVHVIRGATKATIVTADGQEFSDVELLAADEVHDLAVLRIGAHGLKALALGDSAAAKPGEHVVAIGHPLGLGNSVSDGLVSAIRELSPKRTMLQISAPISPGSSGGPVFNDRGEVIGISTLVITSGQNLNFAVPINVLKPLLSIDKGVALAAYRPPEGRKRNIPEHSLTLLDGCSDTQIKAVIGNIEQAIKVGAPLYNDGNIEACYRIYAAAAFDTERKVAACPGPKHALTEGVSNADKLESWEDKAWALRDAFDGVLAVVAKKNGEVPTTDTGEQRQIPHHAVAVFEACDDGAIDSIGKGIAAAINSGAPLYNSGNIEACYRIYEGAIGDIDRKINGCPAAKRALQSGLQNAERKANWRQKAWALRDTFDGMVDAIAQRRASAR